MTVLSPATQPWSDKVIFLQPLSSDHAVEHLDGEDDDIARWLSGGRSSLESVQRYIQDCQKDWRSNGPRRAFGIFDCATDCLIGSIEANTNLPHALRLGQANISYGVFPNWRGRG